MSRVNPELQALYLKVRKLMDSENMAASKAAMQLGMNPSTYEAYHNRARALPAYPHKREKRAPKISVHSIEGEQLNPARASSKKTPPGKCVVIVAQASDLRGILEVF